jgi:hypothetical protein
LARQVAVGEDLYLFHGNEGRSEFLCISSHGETLSSSFVVPKGVRLHYYAPRDRILQMHANFALGIRVEEEIDPGAISPDYGLAKFQGAKRGGGNESYTTIMASIDRSRASIAAGVQTWTQFVDAQGPLPKGVDPEQLKPLFKDYLKSKANLVPMDVLTIRARGLRAIGIGHVSLSTVLETLKLHNVWYPYVFCSFCRYTKGIETIHTTVAY